MTPPQVPSDDGNKPAALVPGPIGEIRLYFAQIPGLLAGRQVPSVSVHTASTEPMTEWKDEDLKLLLDAAIRQHERQWSQLEQIRGRAQFLFTTILVVLAFNISTLKDALDAASTVAFLFWAAGAIALILALAGAAGVVVNRKEMGSVDATLATHLQPPVLRDLAFAYADCVGASVNTVATQLTVFRVAALLTIVGLLLTITSWLVAAL